MNRFVSVLIPLVVLVAMGLVLFQQMMTPKADMRSQNEVKAFVTPPSGTPGSASTAETRAAEDAARTAIGRLAARNVDQAADTQPVQDHDGGQNARTPQNTDAQIDPTRPNRPPQVVQTPYERPKEQETPVKPSPERPSAPAPQAPATPTVQASPTPPPAPKPAPKREEPKGSFVMKNLTLQVAGSEVILKMEADKRFEYRYFLLTNPNRLVVDLTGEWQGLKSPRVPANQLVKSTRYGKFGNGYRFVLDLNEAPRAHSDSRSGNGVEIRLSR